MVDGPCAMRRLVVELTDAEYTRLEQVAFTMPGADLLLLIVSRVLKSKTPAEASAKIREGVPGDGTRRAGRPRAQVDDARHVQPRSSRGRLVGGFDETKRSGSSTGAQERKKCRRGPSGVRGFTGNSAPRRVRRSRPL